MDFTVPKKDLLRLVGRAQAVADKKSTMPVLSNVLLDAVDGQLRVAATDLYLSVSGHCHAEVKRPGSVAVPARDLLERVSKMPDGPVHVVSENGSATVLKADKSARRYTLHGVPGSEFPKLPQPDEAAARLTLGADALELLIRRTQFSISPDDTRPNVNSALFEWQAERVRMVTTDGHRLSKLEIGAKPAPQNTSFLLPLKAVAELRKLAEDARKETPKGEEAVVTLVHASPNAFFVVAGATFSVKLVDATFPSYQQVIPRQSDRSARIPRRELADALDAMKLAASDRTGGVKLTLTSNLLRITSESPESGDGFDEVPIDYAGKDVTIGFNAKYFLDVLGAIDDEEEVTLGFSGELDPAVLRPAKENAERDYLAVIMPMRI